MEAHQKCDIPHIRNVWFNEDSITNIISMQDMTANFRVTMDSKQEKALLVHMPDKVVKFKQFSSGLCAVDPNDKKSHELPKKSSQFLSAVKENLKFLSTRQQKRARRARQLHETMGTPTVDDLKAMIRMNLVKNNMVTTDDLNLAVKAHGPDIGSIEGKTARSKPVPVISDIVEIPDELLEVQQDPIVSMDGLTVNSLKFLSAISHELYYRTAQCVTNPVASACEKCVDELLGICKKGGSMSPISTATMTIAK